MSQRIQYTQDQWLRLIEAIEDDGGAQAEDDLNQWLRCTPRTYSFVGPKKLDPKDRVLEGCDNESLFEIVYDPHEPVHLELDAYDFRGNPKRDDDGTLAPPVTIDHSGEAHAHASMNGVIVCAVCDGIGWWPRYAEVMEDD